MARGLFVTGTDTGVGKTLVSCAMIRALRAAGEKVFVAKPFATGSAEGKDGKRIHPDVALLSQALDSQSVWVGYESLHPAAPSMAARWEGTSLALEAIGQRLRDAIPDDHCAVVEGAGGLLCPVGPGSAMADLAAFLGFPLVVVARRGLGTLNHILLTLEVAQKRGLPVAGVVFSQVTPETDPVEAEVALELARLTPFPVLAEVPFGDLSGKSIGLVDWKKRMQARPIP